MSEPVNFIIEHYDDEELAEANEQLALIAARLHVENAKLRELAHAMLLYIDPASHQDTCGIECPAHSMCKGKSMCSFPDWAVKEAGKMGIEVDG
jgi:hypothetical protein